MPAATAAEWLTAAAIGTAAFVPGALLILGLDHEFRLPRVSLDPALAVAHRAHDAAEHAAQRARLQLAAWLLVLACHLEQPRST